MRDLIITLLVFVSLPFIFYRPYVGVLVWSWLGYMNPHRLAYGFAYNFPYSQVVAIVLIISLLLSKEPKKIPISPVTILWLTFIVWMGITTVFSWYPDEAIDQFIKVLKIQLVILFSLMLMGNRERLNLLVWTIYLSIGFFGIKGGVFTLIGGDGRVWGPAGSFIEGNNELALATLMIIPLGNYLRLQASNKWVRAFLIISMILCLASVLGSYSRGAFVGIGAVALFFWAKNRHKFAIGIGVLLIIPIFIAIMPQKWHDRMDTIVNYEQDASANERFDSWKLALSVANDNVVGGGFNFWSPAAYQKYGDEHTWNYSYVAHNIYLHIAGEHGWPGFLLFVSILALTWRTGSWILRETRDKADLRWASDLAAMLQVSLIAYLVSGVFLSLSYFDLPWHIMSVIVLLKMIVLQHDRQKEEKSSNVSARNMHLYK